MSSPAPQRVSVIVLAYNARAFIGRCLTAVLLQDHPDFEVIVVDNASTDGTAGLVRAEFPQTRLIESQINGGYGAGNNLGAAAASGKVLVFLNPDAIPEPDWLSKLVGAMERNSRKLATSMIVLQSDPQRLNSGGNLVHYLGLSYCRGLNAPRSRYDQPELVSGASGAACAITRTLFQRIGGFDETFFLYHDDVDLSLRALLAGERCLYVPDAVVTHDYDLSVPPIKWGWIEAHRYAILLKVFHARTLLVLLPALVLMDLVTFAYLGMRGRPFIAAKLRSYAWVLRHSPSIRSARRHAQSTRAVEDGDILCVLADHIPFEQLTTSGLATLARLVVDPVFRVYRRATLAIIAW